MRLYKQWHRPIISKWFIKPPHSISRATSIDSDCCRLPTTSVLSNKIGNTVLRSNQFLSTSQVQVSQGHTSYRNKENWNTEVHGGGGLELVKPAREPASSRPKPCAPLKKPHESCPFAASCGPHRKKQDGLMQLQVLTAAQLLLLLLLLSNRRYFQHAHIIPIVGAGKRGEY